MNLFWKISCFFVDFFFRIQNKNIHYAHRCNVQINIINAMFCHWARKKMLKETSCHRRKHLSHPRLWRHRVNTQLTPALCSIKHGVSTSHSTGLVDVVFYDRPWQWNLTYCHKPKTLWWWAISSMVKPCVYGVNQEVSKVRRFSHLFEEISLGLAWA